MKISQNNNSSKATFLLVFARITAVQMIVNLICFTDIKYRKDRSNSIQL